MSFGTIIKGLRRERGLTQNELAETLSITPQAISRWETDMALPDISMLPVLCEYFNVSADTLLEIDPQKKREKIATLLSEAVKYSSRGYNDKAAELLSAGLIEYPDSIAVMCELMCVRYRQYCGDKSLINFRNEAVRLGKEILAKSADAGFRESATQILCFYYAGEGRTEEAVALANSASHIAASNEMLLSGICKGDDGYAEEQNKILMLFQFLSNALGKLIYARYDSGRSVYTDEEKVALRKKRIALIKLLFEDEKFGFYHYHLCDIYTELAIYFAKNGDNDNALLNIYAASEHAVGFDESVNGGEYSCLAFRKMEYGNWATDCTDNESARMLEKLDDPVFDTLRESAELGDIRAKLSAHAGKWQI